MTLTTHNPVPGTTVIYANGTLLMTVTPDGIVVPKTITGTAATTIEAAAADYTDQRVADVVAARQWKEVVAAATTANITLEDEQTIDGVAVVDGDRVLVKAQTAAAENGIYVVVDGGPWERAGDADTSAKLVGATVLVKAGTAAADRQFVCTNDSIASLDATDVVWAQLGSQSYASQDAFDDLSDAVADLSVGEVDANTGAGVSVASAPQATLRQVLDLDDFGVAVDAGDDFGGKYILEGPAGWHTIIVSASIDLAVTAEDGIASADAITFGLGSAEADNTNLANAMSDVVQATAAVGSGATGTAKAVTDPASGYIYFAPGARVYLNVAAAVESGTGNATFTGTITLVTISYPAVA